MNTIKKEIKNIAVFTSGGDCPGLNATLRAVVNRAHYKYGWKIYGMMDGTTSFFEDKPRYRILTPNDFNFYESRISGSIIGCMNKGFSPFNFPLINKKNGNIIMPAGKEDLTPKFKKIVEDLKIDGIIMTGGDGSMNIIYNLCKIAGINVIGIPKTIDNDTPLTETSVGYSSAVDSCVDAMDALITTAHSHQKWMILEVMGRHAGHIAIKAGISGGADAILMPEINYSVENLIKKVKSVKTEEGREYGLIVVAEGAKTKKSDKNQNGDVAKFIAKKLNDAGIPSRGITLGHIQRGGRVNAYDRFLGTSFGVRAVDSLAQGDKYKMMSYSKEGFTKINLQDVAESVTANVDIKSNKIQTAINMGIYIGEIE
jgi:6-phosphofructokinase